MKLQTLRTPGMSFLDSLSVAAFISDSENKQKTSSIRLYALFKKETEKHAKKKKNTQKYTTERKNQKAWVAS